MKQEALANIEKALIEIIKMARAGYQAAESIEIQLNWCKSYLSGLPTTKRPGRNRSFPHVIPALRFTR